MPCNDFGKFMTDECQQIAIKPLVHQFKRTLQRGLLDNPVEIDGYSIYLQTSRTGQGGRRYWFTCPLCQRRVGVLYKHPFSQKVGCRKCQKLRYRKQAKNGMIEEGAWFKNDKSVL